jgi:hypothetical protein
MPFILLNMSCKPITVADTQQADDRSMALFPGSLCFEAICFGRKPLIVPWKLVELQQVGLHSGRLLNGLGRSAGIETRRFSEQVATVMPFQFRNEVARGEGRSLSAALQVLAAGRNAVFAIGCLAAPCLPFFKDGLMAGLLDGMR